MKLMTYNILKGGDGRLPLLLEVIAAQAPDVLALQECNDFCADGGARLRQVEDALGMRGVVGPSASGYDVALFAPLRAWRMHSTLRAGFERAAVLADLQIGDDLLHVAALHLDPYDPAHRLSEVHAVIDAMHDAPAVVVMGDLNAISPGDVAGLDTDAWPERYRTRHGLGDGGALDTRAVAALQAAGMVDLAAAAADGGAPARTRPTALATDHRVPGQRIDYVFASSGLAARVQRVEVVDDARAQRASDHLPVVVTIA